MVDAALRCDETLHSPASSAAGEQRYYLRKYIRKTFSHIFLCLFPGLLNRDDLSELLPQFCSSYRDRALADDDRVRDSTKSNKNQFVWKIIYYRCF